MSREIDHCFLLPQARRRLAALVEPTVKIDCVRLVSGWEARWASGPACAWAVRSLRRAGRKVMPNQASH